MSMRAIDQYTDRELKNELVRREKEREKLNQWHVFERRISDGAIYRIDRHGALTFDEAMVKVQEANESYRGDRWNHFCAPVGTVKEAMYNV